MLEVSLKAEGETRSRRAVGVLLVPGGYAPLNEVMIALAVVGFPPSYWQPSGYSYSIGRQDWLQRN
jgi:hypothetical protein